MKGCGAIQTRRFVFAASPFLREKGWKENSTLFASDLLELLHYYVLFDEFYGG